MNSDYDEHEGRPELVQKRAVSIMLKNGAIGVLVFFLTVILLLDLWAAYESAAQRDRLLDCTTPGGECFNEGQKRTGAVVKGLIDESLLQELATRRVVVLAAQCANRPGPQTTVEVERCVKKGLG